MELTLAELGETLGGVGWAGRSGFGHVKFEAIRKTLSWGLQQVAGRLTLHYGTQEGQGGSQETLGLYLAPPDVFKNALRLGTFSAVLVTYAASALLHVSRVEGD